MNKDERCDKHGVVLIKRFIRNPGASGRRGFGHYVTSCPECEKEYEKED